MGGVDSLLPLGCLFLGQGVSLWSWALRTGRLSTFGFIVKLVLWLETRAQWLASGDLVLETAH